MGTITMNAAVAENVNKNVAVHSLTQAVCHMPIYGRFMSVGIRTVCFNYKNLEKFAPFNNIGETS